MNKTHIKQLNNIYDILFNNKQYPEARKEFDKWSKNKNVEIEYTENKKPYILIGKKFKLELQ